MSLSPLVITPGEPAGIGPDLCIMLAGLNLPCSPPPVIIADPTLLEERAKSLGLPLSVREFDPTITPSAEKNSLTVLPCPLSHPVEAGKLDRKNSPYVLQCLDLAIAGCMQGTFAGMVTGPVHKGIINQAGIAFTGHTEYLANKSNSPSIVMMLATEKMKVALATTHLPLSEVSAAITPSVLTNVIQTLRTDLIQKFGISEPTLLVCGLNPHAGEGGHLGREEIDTIIPTLEDLKNQGIRLIGPLPADTLFTEKNLVRGDAVLAMYHDQGLPVLKYQGFGKAVNITLGLPFIRTSVDHGTALELAATGNAETGSLVAALEQAASLTMKMNHEC